jgi:uroporphyrinogen decarboxylase
MSKRVDVLDSIAHKQPEIIPWDFRFTKKSHQLMADYYQDPFFESKIGNCFTIIRANVHREIEPKIWVDQFGVKWDRRLDPDIGVVLDYQVMPENIGSFSFPDPNDFNIYRHYAKAIETSDPNTLIIVKMSYNLFERAWSLCGFENFMKLMISDPHFVNLLLDKIVAYNLKVIDNISKYHVDGILFGDDWGQQTGLLISPKTWKNYIEPRIQKMYSKVRKYGLIVMHHSCGKIDAILPNLIEAGLDVLNPFQPEVMDIYDIKKKFGNQLSFYGGISTQESLPFHNVKRVKEQTKRLINEVGENGGLIVSAAHAIMADAKPENVAAMIETLQNQ